MPNVNIYHGAFDDEDVHACVFSYTDGVSINDKEILARAFEMFNAPFEYLNEEDQAIFKMYRPLRSLSVGDVVEINGLRYQCMPIGWEHEEDVIKAKGEELIKHHGQFMKRKDVEKRKAEARKDLIEGLEKMIEAEKKKEIDKGIAELIKNK